MTRARKNGILVNLNYNDLQNKPLEFPPEAHTHAIVDVTGLQMALDEKSEIGHNHDGDYDPQGTATAKMNSHETTYNHGNIHEPGSDKETAESIAAIHSGVAEDTTTDTDTFSLIKSATGALKKITWSSIKSTLKAYFDNIYSTFSGSWIDLTDKPSVFPPDTHTHSELHSHANKAELDNYDPAYFAAAGHNHDSRYYTESEMDTKLSGKSDSVHTHSQLHSHTNKADLDNYDPANFLGTKAKAADSDKLDGQHASEFASASHAHDSRYYTESEVDTKLSSKVDDTDSRLSDARTPTDNSVNYTKVDSTLKSQQSLSSGAINLAAGGGGKITLTANTAFSFSGFQLHKSYLLEVTANGFTPSFADLTKHRMVTGNAAFDTVNTFFINLVCVDATPGSEMLLTTIMKEA